MSEKNEIQVISSEVDKYTNKLLDYLDNLNLPSNNVIVPVGERLKVVNNLPMVLESMNDEAKERSVYISKFVFAVGAGLFDAALNYIWDETIKSLRIKVARFDLEYFYISTISDPDRLRKLKTEDDLRKIDDWELIKGCSNIGILSEIGYRHMDHIRYMRNWASAAHPNHVELTGFQLVGWLETCIREVIGKEPSEYGIQIQILLKNIREQDLDDVSHTLSSLELVPTELVNSLLKTIFGMYIDPLMAVNIKNNIKLIAKRVWELSDNDLKYEIALQYSTYAANADVEKKNKANEFLGIVEGLSYLPKDTLTIEISNRVDGLYQAHNGINNFYSEPLHARELYRYVPKNGKIPNEVFIKYIKTISLCYLGNGYGVSGAAYGYYEDLINRFEDKEIYEFLKLFFDIEFSSNLQSESFRNRCKKLIELFIKRTTGGKIMEILNNISLKTDSQLQYIGGTTEFKKFFEK